MVNNAPLSSEDVLGIIPGKVFGLNCQYNYVIIAYPLHTVSSISNRPRSSTSPGVQLSSGQSASSEAVGNRSRTKKRSYSAVVPRSWTVDGWEELFISKQVGLVPQTRTKQDQSQVKHSSIVGGQPQPQHPSTNRPRILPPVTSNFNRQSEDSPSAVETLKVEIKGLKIDKQPTSQKPSNDSSSPASPRLPLLIPSLSSAPNEPHNAANCNPTPSPGSSEKATKCTAHSPGVKTATESSNTCTPPPTAGKVSASIVSLGKTGSVVGSRQTRPKHVHNRHRHPSSGKQSGRLSSGWSAPKPVGNIKGTPLQVPPHPHTHTDSNKHTSEQERVVSPEMHITVTEYLLDDKQ